MTLVVNLVRTVPAAKFIYCCWRNPWCDCHVTHTPKWSTQNTGKLLKTFFFCAH